MLCCISLCATGIAKWILLWNDCMPFLFPFSHTRIGYPFCLQVPLQFLEKIFLLHRQQWTTNFAGSHTDVPRAPALTSRSSPSLPCQVHWALTWHTQSGWAGSLLGKGICCSCHAHICYMHALGEVLCFCSYTCLVMGGVTALFEKRLLGT